MIIIYGGSEKRQVEIAVVNNLEINSLAYLFTLMICSLIIRCFRFLIPGDATFRSNKMAVVVTKRM
jgi:hypothetical protein